MVYIYPDIYISSYICVRTLRLQVVGLSSGNTDLIQVNNYMSSGTTTTHLTPSESAPPDIQKVHVLVNTSSSSQILNYKT